MAQGTRDPQPFWQMPPPWVWCVFLLSVGILSASMLTWREGRRFVSRRLRADEVRLVNAALTLWESSADVREAGDVARLRGMLRSGRLLAMASPTFSRAEERSTFGYSDEHGRVLLNPNLCFANQRMCAPAAPDGADVTATMFTLYHESRHLFHGASEARAYEEEWRFVRSTSLRLNGPGLNALAREVDAWEQEMPLRVDLYVGASMAEEMRARVAGSMASKG